jgi:uncharacterized membrane protein
MNQVNHRHKSRHIVRSFEASEFKKRSFIIKLADALTSSFGTFIFLLLNIAVFVTWIVVNSGRTGITPFDPFPFLLLSVAVSSYAILLSIVVLISQNRENQTNRLRQELQLQVNLITEREITKALKVLQELREEIKKGKVKDEELEEMVKEVDTSYIERKLAEQLEAKEESLTKAVTEPIEKLLKK